MISIVDTGGANLASIRYALDRLGKESITTVDPALITKASHVILPGVGAARHCMEKLERAKLVPCLRSLSVPTLGICLGMQILFGHSEEGNMPCLGVLPGTVTRLEPEDGRTIPHMGWNQVRTQGDPSALFRDTNPAASYYFVHSYVAPFGPWVRAAFDYGGKFPAVVQSDNFFGVQFHPERSAEAGARILRNFLAL